MPCFLFSFAVLLFKPYKPETMYLSRLPTPSITNIFFDREIEAQSGQRERAKAILKQSPLTRIKDFNRDAVQVLDHNQQPQVRHSPVQIITDENHSRGFRGIRLYARAFEDWNYYSLYNDRSGVEDSVGIDGEESNRSIRRTIEGLARLADERQREIQQLLIASTVYRST
jgi:hypothetical protein